MLVTSAPLAEKTGLSGVKMPSTPNFSMNQRSLACGVVVAAGHRAGVADRARQLRFPAPDDAGDDRLGEVGVELVVAARLDIEHRRLAARVVGQREGELGRGVVDVDVLAARDQRRRAPARHAQIGGDRGGEVAGVGEDRDRALASAPLPGLSPPSAPPMRTWFQASATPRLLPPKMSMPFCWPIARISRESCTESFSVTMKIFSSSGLTRISSATPSRAPAGGR